MQLRPMTEDDVRAAVEMTHAVWVSLAASAGHPADPLDERYIERESARHGHFVQHDPGGCWVAEQDDRLIGVALASVRGDLWGLSLLGVHPDAQSHGIGSALLAAALRYGDGLRGSIVSSPDPRALRAYARAGFALHPTVEAVGTVDRSRLPAMVGVRDGGPDWLGFADEVDVVVRRAPHGPDHARLLAGGRMLVVDCAAGRGYAYTRPGRGVGALAATTPAAATSLFTAVLAEAEGEVSVWMSAAQQWMLPVVLAARLGLASRGAFFFRGMAEPAPYIPSGPYL